MNLSEQARYYLISFVTMAIFWSVLLVLNVDFINIIFFIMAFTWHFALLAPGLREKILTTKTRFSFLSVAIRINHYLQLFLPAHKIPHGSALVRSLSPLLFSFILFVAGGAGNLLFTLFGSLVFEGIYLLMNEKIQKKEGAKENKDDPEIPPAIPSEENVHE